MNNESTLTAAAFLFLGGATACAQRAADTLEIVTDVEYARVGDVSLQLDYCRPPADGPLPALMLIHGGGWKEGHRSAYRGRIRKIAARGYVGVTISHRLTAEVGPDGKPLFPWPAAIHDCKAAVRHLRSHAAEYGIDPDRIAAGGASSGGHLALLLALTGSGDGLEGNGPPDDEPLDDEPLDDGPLDDGAPTIDTRVAAAVSLSGPTEMASCYYAPVVRPYASDLLGGGPLDSPVAYARSSPLHYLDADDPPVMLAHGADDRVVPVAQSNLFYEESKELGRSADVLMVLPGEPHVFTRNAGPRVWDRAIEFLDEVMGPSKRD